jgi:hypothetical protein
VAVEFDARREEVRRVAEAGRDGAPLASEPA